ncbi:hypothetical protein L3V77_07815 [Vibrio sp. DW001]|uniref:hypothetical protein n=1 Tax=Vibrio sp. DW001 TaxID=2912315 RepID=UPI0023B0F266|nr:hypothetical protein [Vibrio sp. DW001]WED26435.1 hypothetical protein L3V77_15770 [Vibrio sp. DW001]WED28122.1 hypothetical protein L3V77_07815 [Vibrio sp. DW001]
MENSNSQPPDEQAQPEVAKRREKIISMLTPSQRPPSDEPVGPAMVFKQTV